MLSAIAFADDQMRATLADFAGFDFSLPGVNPDWSVENPFFPKATQSATGDVEWGFQSRYSNWGAGFTPGLMWDLYELTGDPYWKEKAAAFTDGMEVTKTAGGDMQMNIGFHMMNSYARRFDLIPNASADAIVLSTAADHLATNSWMPNVGSLWSFSWGRGFRYDGRQGGFARYENTIIDSAPNLEILFYQAKQEGDETMWNKAVSHLNNLVRDNIRPDGSTVQLVSYDADTGAIEGPRGHQGYSPESTWSRGQGWALHGFASAWREMRDPAVGDVFHQLFTFYRDHAPADGIPYWDFDAPYIPDADLQSRYPDDDPLPIRFARDTSAAALAASSLMLAARLAESEERSIEYFLYGKKILESLSTSGYLSTDGSGNPVRESILRQGSYTFPGVDKGQIWGDFYFVEALRRYRDLVEPEMVFDDSAPTGNLDHYRYADPRRWQVRPDRGSKAVRLQGRDQVSQTYPADIALYGPVPVEDFTFSFRFRPDELLSAANPVDAVVVFGYVDPEHYHFVRFSSDSSLSGVYSLDDGVLSLVSALNLAWSGQDKHGFRLSLSGDQLTLEQLPPVDNDEDSDIPWGNVQLAGFDRSGYLGIGGMGHSLYFDDIALTGPVSAWEFSPRYAWRNLHFSHPNSIYAWDFFDPDGDGRVNLFEYALGSDPNSPSDLSQRLDLSLDAGGNSVLEFPYNTGFWDIIYSLQRSTDGGDTWSDVRTIHPSGAYSWSTSRETFAAGVSPAVLYRLVVNGLP